MSNTYIPSTTPGKHWNVSTGNNRAGFVTGNAVEGTCGNSTGFNTFTYTLFEARRVEVATTAKRATAKAEGQAMHAIVAKLIEDGLAVIPAATAEAA